MLKIKRPLVLLDKIGQSLAEIDDLKKRVKTLEILTKKY